MKKGILALTISLAAVLLAGGAVAELQAADYKIGYVDLARVFDEYEKTKEFDKDLEKKGSGKQAERDELVGVIRKLRDEAELLSADARDSKRAVIDEKIKALQEFDRKTRTVLRRERDQMVREILGEIQSVIRDFGKKEGYSFIFNDRVLVFKSEGNDLTEQVIKALNESYTKKP